MPREIYIYLALFFSAYLIGAIPWAFVIGKFNGIDIREHGSGNVGATNVRRTLGKKWAITCFFLDFLKGFLPVLMLKILVGNKVIPETDLGIIIVAFASVAGHMWPVYLKFKGGKGISTIAGILLALAPLSLLTAGIVWALFFYTTRYVSLASIAASLILPVSAISFTYLKIMPLERPELIMLTFLALLAIFRHRGNIKRLLKGTENKFEKKKKEDKGYQTGKQ